MFNEFFDRNDGKSDNNDAYHEEYQEQMGDEDNMVEDPDEEENEQELYIPKARKDAFQNEDSFLSDPKAGQKIYLHIQRHPFCPGTTSFSIKN